MYRCAGVGGAITGTGADFLIVDDPFKTTRGNVTNYRRRKVWEWPTSTFYASGKDAGIMIIQTRWHETTCPARYSINKEKAASSPINGMLLAPGYSRKKKLKAILVEKSVKAYGRKSMTKVFKIAKSTLWGKSIQRLYQQTTPASGGQVIKAKWLKALRSERQISHAIAELLQSRDMSFWICVRLGVVCRWIRLSQDRRSDLFDRPSYAVSGTLLEQTVAQVRARHKWPVATRKLIEKKANGQAVIDTVSNEIQRNYSDTLRSSWNPRVVKPTYEAGNVLFMLLWKRGLIDHISEMLSLLAKHDDQVDAESQHWTIGVKELSENDRRNVDLQYLRTLILRKTGGSIFSTWDSRLLIETGESNYESQSARGFRWVKDR